TTLLSGSNRIGLERTWVQVLEDIDECEYHDADRQEDDDRQCLFSPFDDRRTLRARGRHGLEHHAFARGDARVLRLLREIREKRGGRSARDANRLLRRVGGSGKRE